MSFSTSPSSKETHWKQTVFYFREKMWVCCDDILDGVIEVKKVPENPRDLDVSLKLTLNQKGNTIEMEQQYRIRFLV